MFFNDVLKQEKFDIYVPESYRAFFEEFEKVMQDDLVEFNKNKDANIHLFLEKVPEANLNESLPILNEAGLLDQHTLRLLNTALFSLYFTSVDYKPPEKKPQQNADGDPSQAQDVDQGDETHKSDQGDGDAGDGDQQADNDAGDGDQDAGDKQDGDNQDAGGDGAANQQADGGNQGDQQQQAQPEEEWKAPEITEEELQMVKARERLRVVFVHTVRSQDTLHSSFSMHTKPNDPKAKPEDKVFLLKAS